MCVSSDTWMSQGRHSQKSAMTTANLAVCASVCVAVCVAVCVKSATQRSPAFLAVHCCLFKAARHCLFEKFSKTQRATKYAMSNHCRSDF